jgi:predicted HTH domain antitoxin
MEEALAKADTDAVEYYANQISEFEKEITLRIIRIY